jgi:UDP-galactopyranose mutase
MTVLIVGAGISGLTLARLLKDAGCNILVFEQKLCIGGACTDHFNGKCYISNHGPHVFHTNNKRVWDFILKYTEIIHLKPRVLAKTIRGMIPVPFNDESAEIAGNLNSEQIIDLIFKPYSEKMWGVEWKDLPDNIKNRIPLRALGRDGFYFDSLYQGVPKHGYMAMFYNLTDGIKIELGVNQNEWKKQIGRFDRIFFCGRPDSINNYLWGMLNYRTVRFMLDWGQQHPIGITSINNCLDDQYTRVGDYSRIYNTKNTNTANVLLYEKPARCELDDEPYYPMWDFEKFKLYENEFKKSKIDLLGRAATYKYINMDEAIDGAMALSRSVNAQI